MSHRLSYNVSKKRVINSPKKKSLESLNKSPSNKRNSISSPAFVCFIIFLARYLRAKESLYIFWRAGLKKKCHFQHNWVWSNRKSWFLHFWNLCNFSPRNETPGDITAPCSGDNWTGTGGFNLFYLWRSFFG